MMKFKNTHKMKKYYLIGMLFSLGFVQLAVSQPAKVTSAWNYIQSKEYDKARDAINIAITNDRTKEESNTWLYRGQAYQGIYSDPKLKAKEPNALKESGLSFRKSIELEKKKKHPDTRDATTGLVFVTLSLFNEGEIAFGAKNYIVAEERLEDFLTSYDALGDDKKKIDEAFSHTTPPTDIREVKLLLAGCAMQLNRRDKAVKNFEELAATKFPTPLGPWKISGTVFLANSIIFKFIVVTKIIKNESTMTANIL